MLLGVPYYVAGGAALVICAIPLLAWSFGGPRRIRVSADGTVAADSRQTHLKQGPLDRIIVPIAKALGRRVRAITPAGWVSALDRRIKVAGSPKTWPLERTLAFKLFLGVVGALGTVTLKSDSFGVSTIFLTIGATLFGYFLPDLLLYSRGRERQKLILRELPDTLDQLTISVEAGLGFDAALTRVAATGTGPLGEELRRVLAEIKVGVPRTEALRHLLDRTTVFELRHFVLALNQAEQYGLPVARVLRIQSGELRTKRRQRAEEEAMKIPVKIVFPLVFCIFPALFVVLLGPAMIRVARVLF